MATATSVVSASLLLGLMLHRAAIADSDLDPGWNPPGGYSVTTPGVGNASPHAIALDGMGRVLVAGDAQPAVGGFTHFTVVRYVGDNDPALTGYEDASFGNGGIATANIGANNAVAYAVVGGADGSAVVAGECSDISAAAYRAFCLLRFNSSGALDLGFGDLGRTISTIGPDHAYARAMAVDSSGRLLVAGTSSHPGSGRAAFTVARYSADGHVDSSFGTGGYSVVGDPAGGDASAYAIAIDTDGSIVLAGSVFNLANMNGAAAAMRLDSNGAPDAGFNGGAIASIAFANGGGANAVAIDAQHRPVLAGVALAGGAQTSSAMALARYTGSGGADATFGSGGAAVVTLPGCTDANATAIGIDAGGRYYVGGYCHASQDVLALAHVGTRGTLDSAYGGKGYTAERFGSQAGITALLIDARGRPLVAGYDLRGNGLYAYVVNRHDVLFSDGME